MDLGASICLPKGPKCDLCPVAGHCRALADDACEDFPRKPAPVPKKEQDWTILLVMAGDRLLVRRRPKGLLGGLYEFAAVEGHFDEGALAARLDRLGFGGIRLGKRLPDAKHVFTHRVWRMRGWLVRCEGYPGGLHPRGRRRPRRPPLPLRAEGVPGDRRRRCGSRGNARRREPHRGYVACNRDTSHPLSSLQYVGAVLMARLPMKSGTLTP